MLGDVCDDVRQAGIGGDQHHEKYSEHDALPQRLRLSCHALLLSCPEWIPTEKELFWVQLLSYKLTANAQLNLSPS
jgi:hypothetical protein